MGGRGVVVGPMLRFELAMGELAGVVLHESWERGGEGPRAREAYETDLSP